MTKSNRKKQSRMVLRIITRRTQEQSQVRVTVRGS